MIPDEELDRLRSLSTAGDRCWAFNALPQVRQEKWRIYRRIKFLVDQLDINPENAKIETFLERSAFWRTQRSTLPPSGLPAISPTQGGRLDGRYGFANLQRWRLAKVEMTANLPPCGGDVRQDREGAPRAN